jgi:hypothetical protein
MSGVFVGTPEVKDAYTHMHTQATAEQPAKLVKGFCHKSPTAVVLQKVARASAQVVFSQSCACPYDAVRCFPHLQVPGWYQPERDTPQGVEHHDRLVCLVSTPGRTECDFQMCTWPDAVRNDACLGVLMS